MHNIPGVLLPDLRLAVCRSIWVASRRVSCNLQVQRRTSTFPGEVHMGKRRRLGSLCYYEYTVPRV